MNPSMLINLLRDNPVVVTGMGCFSAAFRETAVAGHRGKQ